MSAPAAADKRALLARLLQEKAARTRRSPLSFAQERLWFLDRLDPESSAYNVPVVLELRGALDVEALRRALEEMVRRHEVLRSRIEVADGAPVQVLGPVPSPWPLPVHALSGGFEEQRAEARRRVAEEARHSFSLAEGPLLRTELLRASEELHVLVLHLHHIVSDGWSLGVVFRELEALYPAFAAGREPSLPPLPLQYADFAAWQRRHLSGAVLEERLAYWRERLEGAPTLLTLPTDRPRPAVETRAGARHTSLLPPELEDALRAMARAEGATLFMVLLAAFQLVLGRYARQERVVVGTPIAGRLRSELEPLIGLFVNTLALSADLSGAPSFRALLGRVRETTLGAFAHQDLPFEKLVEELRPERSRSHSPVFQVMFALQNGPGQAPRIPGLEVRVQGQETGDSLFDITLSAHELEEGILCAFDYRPDLFDEATIERMVAHLRGVLEAVAADPAVPCAAALPAGESPPPVGAEWHEAARRTVHALVEARAAEAPDAPAMVLDEGPVSFRELDARANRLAHALRRLGVGPERRVAVALPPQPDVLVALLAILKAGGTYLPLDPAYPPERTAFVLEDAEVAAVVTTAAGAAALPEQRAPVLRVDADAEAIAAEPSAAPEVAVHPESAAYTIYTSGSTGRPKGVVVSHGAAAAHLRAAAAAYGLGPGERVMGFTAISFDPSIEQMLAPLAAGGAVAFRGGGDWSPAAFAARAEALGVTMANLPTAYWHALADDPAARARLRRTVRLVLIGGEACRPSAVAAWLGDPGDAVLLNGYGPTEGIVTATTHAASEADPGAARVPIGTTLGGRTVHLLDETLRPVADGIPGELFLGGPALARGYLGRPALTAERFVPDPFATEPGARLYRTGDLARRLPSGELDFLGRSDAQVKIRGFRVEPGEVEAALRALPGVADAVVDARDDGTGVRLVGYFVPEEGAALVPASLRAALAGRLPDYMVPSALAMLARLPIGPGGKVDRAALQTPEAAAPTGYVAPRTAAEAALAAIWAEVLGVERVGATDDFFDLGGHSLLAVRLLAEISRRFGRTLQVAALFEDASVAAVARLLAADGDAAPTRLVPLSASGAGAPLFLAHAAAGTVAGYLPLARALGGERPVYGLEAVGLRDGETTPDSLREMARRHVEEVRRARPDGPCLIGGWSLGGTIAFEMARILAEEGCEVPALLLIDGLPPSARAAPAPAAADAVLLAVIARDLRYPADRLPALVGRLRQLPPAALYPAFREEMREAGVPLPERWLPELERMVRLARSSVASVEAYRPDPYRGRVVFLRAAADAAERLARTGADPASTLPADDPRVAAWLPFAAEGIELIDVPGDHHSMLAEPHVRSLAARIGEALALEEAPR